jgi:tetratricopeptide (TPR) repeat protein
MGQAGNMVDSENTTSGDGISSGKRKRLQQCFEHANLQMRQENFDYATVLFTQCILGDASNPLYAQGFIANLKQKYKNNKRGSSMAFFNMMGLRGMIKKASMQKDWQALLKHGVEGLKLNPWDVGMLVKMADACEALGYDQTQLVYLRQALELNPKDPQINRLCALALRVQGQFDQAIACWHRVEQAKPDDEEAPRAIASLAVEKTIHEGKYDGGESKLAKSGDKSSGDAADSTPEQRFEREIRRNPKETSNYIEFAEFYLREEHFKKAVEIYQRALKVFKGNIDFQERIEDAQMRDSRSQMAEAEKQAKKTGAAEDKKRYEDMKQFVQVKDLELAKNRVERYPNNLRYKFEFGDRLKRFHKFNEAIAQFQTAKNDPKYRGPSDLALGQCFQKIEQFRLALKHFEASVDEISERDAENKKLALYYAGRLSVFLGDIDRGERHLSTLAGLEYGYRDVATLLDKIAQIRENKKSQVQEPPPPPQRPENTEDASEG